MRRWPPAWPVAVGDSAASGPDSCAPSTTNCGPGLINNSCWPAGSAIGSRSQGWAAHRRAVQQRAHRGPDRGVHEPAGDRDDRTVLAVDGDLATRGCGPRRRRRSVLPSVPSTAISASPGGLSWSKPSALRSMTSSQSSRLIVTVSVTRGFSDRVCGAGMSSNVRTCGPSPRSTATIVGCAGTVDRLGGEPQPGHLGGLGQGEGERRRGLVLHHPLRRRPCGGRVAVGGRVCRAEDVDQSRSRRGPGWCPARRPDRPAWGPDRGRTHIVGVTDIGVGHGQGAAEVDRRLPVPAPSTTRTARVVRPGRSPACPAVRIPGPIARRRIRRRQPGTSTVCRRSTGCANPEASYWVIDRSVIAELHPGGSVVGADAVIRTHGVSP